MGLEEIGPNSPENKMARGGPADIVEGFSQESGKIEDLTQYVQKITDSKFQDWPRGLTPQIINHVQTLIISSTDLGMVVPATRLLLEIDKNHTILSEIIAPYSVIKPLTPDPSEPSLEQEKLTREYIADINAKLNQTLPPKVRKKKSTKKKEKKEEELEELAPLFDL